MTTITRTGISGLALRATIIALAAIMFGSAAAPSSTVTITAAAESQG